MHIKIKTSDGYTSRDFVVDTQDISLLHVKYTECDKYSMKIKGYLTQANNVIEFPLSKKEYYRVEKILLGHDDSGVEREEVENNLEGMEI